MITAVNLMMTSNTLIDLQRRARLHTDDDGAAEVLAACTSAYRPEWDPTSWRVTLPPEAVTWIEVAAPDIAVKWPAVFDSVETLHDQDTLGALIARIRRTADGTRVQADVDANGDVVQVRLWFDASGESLVVTTDTFGMRLRWRDAAEAARVAVSMAQRQAVRDDARGEADR